MTDYLFKTKPFEHQLHAFMLSRDEENFALLMEQGTGKTKVAIDTCAWNYSQGRINAVIVIAPNGVHRNWIKRELPVHLPDHVPYRAVYRVPEATKKSVRAWDSVGESGMFLRFFAINVEYLSLEQGKKLLASLLMTFNCMVIVDESSTIKTPGASRTKTLVNWRHRAKMRRILTGTPVTKGPLDLYSQFKFLDPEIIGFHTFTEFRNHFAEVEKHTNVPASQRAGREVTYDEIVGYKNIDQLQRAIAPFSYRVRKEECLDLPPKVYERRPVDLSATQKRMYAQMLKESVAEVQEACARARIKAPKDMSQEELLAWVAAMPLHGNSVSTEAIIAKTALEKMLRLQQILCGIIPQTETAPARSLEDRFPRLDSLIDDLSEVDGQVIIWARFQLDVERIADRLGRQKCVMYYGKTSARDRATQEDDWHAGRRNYWLANQQACPWGLTLNESSDTRYYSNNFSLELRLQSEDRNHRIGQGSSVTYTDYEADDTIDSIILDRLKEKRELSDLILNEDTAGGWL